jgi:hypothetical protein
MNSSEGELLLRANYFCPTSLNHFDIRLIMARMLFPILALLFTCVYSLPSVGEVFSQLARRAAPPTWSTILRTVPWDIVQVSTWGPVPGTLDQPVVRIALD